MKKSLFRSFWLPLILTLVLGAAEFFVALPSLNLRSREFWGFIIPLLFIFTALSLVLGTSLAEVTEGFRRTRETHKLHIGLPLPAKLGVAAIAAAFVLVVLGELLASPILRARSYAAQGNDLITHGDFAADVPTVSDGQVNDIAIMNTLTAATMGARQIGSLGTLATQYELGGFMTTTINERILKVAPLGYGDFWKWMNRRSAGIPGYVTVDPVTGASSYVELATPMHYSNTGYFMENVSRKMRFAYPTAITANLHFEIDNSGNPYWVQTVYTPKVGLFSCPVPTGIITCDAVTGECERYDMADLPDWVSIAWPADDLMRLVDYAGWYSGGYLNSMFAKTGVYHTTDDYGFKQVGQDLNAFTGITSAAGDESNIGFILCDMHSGSIILYDVYGAEEYSAMVAAEGLVMNYGYNASFPSLINVEGSPVYIMALTDSGNLIKKYALVDLQDYTKVAVGDTVQEAWLSYVGKYEGGAANLPSSVVDENGDTVFEPWTLEMLLDAAPAFATVNGSTNAYISGEPIYCIPVEGNEEILFVRPGDGVALRVERVNANGLYICSLEGVTRGEEMVSPTPSEELPEEGAATEGEDEPAREEAV